ncbi:putative hydrolase or acyltransferase of alpha/beta superfamily [Terriglobus roseus DSM 18391]|uniref:Putative hydrolase or acyltransferase of alpha/beta superfamily n=1 Tax=Terriglobus roseus (strain DSM 18391 / NRRL B-41598 / KBS 63) TaxID=926566 RepID=I3ZF45_TERRK|nr:putative hydrolase or acyltransferase of alpha/beta superfamily [Terriglobus roseus DSM 18391]
MSGSLTRRWPIYLASVAGLVVVLALVVWLNPFLLIDAGIDVYLRGHGVKHHHVDVEGYSIQYLEAKPPAGSPEKPLVLVHGLGARATDWTPLIPTLAAHGYHVYALDLLGYGNSPKPRDGDASLAVEERITLGFLQALHLDKPDVAGWSMGGWVAMKLALDHPEHVRRLLLYDSAGLYFIIDFPYSLFTPSDRAGFDALMERIEPDQPRMKMPAFVIPGMLRRFEKSRSIVDSSFHSMLTGREILDFRVHALKMPVLIVWGTEDKLTPLATGLRLHELVPQSVFVGLRGCGHLAAAECSSAALPATIKFLDAEPPMAASATYIDVPR